MGRVKHLTSPQKGDTKISYLGRVFNHMMDIGGYTVGTWITARLRLETNPSKEAIKKVLTDRLLDMKVFRSIAVASGRTSGFRELPMEEFDWEYHLNVRCEGESVSATALQEISGELQSLPMDLKKPLWKVILIPELEEGGSMLFVIFSHAIADGIAGIGLLLKIVDDSPIDPTLPFDKQKDNDNIIKKRKKKNSLSTATKVKTFFSGVWKGFFAITLPVHDPRNSLKLKARNIFDHEQYQGRKQFARSDPIPLDEIKEIKNRFEGATVNDIFMALLTMAVRNFLEAKKDPVLKKKNKVRGSMPVSRRKRNEALLKGGGPANNWEPLMLRLPLSYKSPCDCVWKIKNQIDKEKVSPTLIVQRSLASRGVSMVKRSIVISLVAKAATRASLMLSNVPGPQELVHLAGVPVTDIDFMLNAPIGTYLGVFTYNGEVVLTVNGDEQCDYKAHEIADAWAQAYNELKLDLAQYQGMIPKKTKDTQGVHHFPIADPQE